MNINLRTDDILIPQKNKEDVEKRSQLNDKIIQKSEKNPNIKRDMFMMCMRD